MEEIFDIAIIGGGPAGLSAALTGRVRKKSVAIFESGNFSVKLKKAHEVDNYLGLPHVTGATLMEQFYNHAMSYKPTVIREKVVNVFPGEVTTLLTPNGAYQAKTVIITTGVNMATSVEGEKDFLGRGVSYCATCDGAFFKGKTIAVCAYMEEALEEVAFLAELAEKVYLLVMFAGELPTLPDNVEVLKGKKLEALEGDTKLKALRLSDTSLEVDGVFFLRQADPLDNLVPGILLEENFIAVNHKLETNLAGLYAAGDVTGAPLQIAKAVGEGQAAALNAISYLARRVNQ